MDLASILRACGPHIWDSKIKLVRHRDTRYDSEMLDRMGHLDVYESHQGRPVFGDAGYILSFLGERGTRSRFVGCRLMVGPRRPRKKLPPGFPYPEMTFGPHCYELETVAAFEDLDDRLG